MWMILNDVIKMREIEILGFNNVNKEDGSRYI